MEKKIKSYDQFIDQLKESDGFGTEPFLFRKDGDVFYYFFQLDLEKGGQTGFVTFIGKYSEYETLEGPKNSHAVLNVNQIGSEIIEDIAINKETLPQMNNEKFKLEGNDLSRYFEQVNRCIINYLEKNPKVIRIIDEMHDNLDIENYEEYAKSMYLSALGSEWAMQEGSHRGIYILSR